ncbi:glycogen debranching enzyme-like [Pseudoliparis swirei]|uniref:glycogen debranching enzyme-like n=1 Tax=Pseudoliparis swirei TaxID=2059687 RepID=UPI0024BE26E3|nr:glycogen debranching enzyme-like [Pseudoliparis swirei]
MFIPGRIEEVVLEARTVERPAAGYVKDGRFINGMPEYSVEIREHLPVQDSSVVTLAAVTSKGPSEFVQEVTFQKLTPGSVIAFRVSLDPKAQQVAGVLRFYLSQFSPKYKRGRWLLGELLLDGLPADFYKHFWKCLGADLWEGGLVPGEGGGCAELSSSGPERY